MKILSITLNNLHSLRGEQKVELDKEPLRDSGLFAITGATGSGKSTVLDALTLALFGRSPRYGNEANPVHVMSRHCGECSAEVEFRVNSGDYRAVWQLHRARKKPDGALQQAARYLYDSDGATLAQKKGEADAKILELTGLDYERFLRSVLLAQGKFAKFLESEEKDRAALLESLTGTDIYSRLGMRAFREAADRENALRQREGEIARIEILPDEERAELQKQITEGNAELEKIGIEIKSGAALVKQIDDLTAAKTRESEALAKQQDTEKTKKEKAADLERLRLHRLAQPFTVDLTELKAAEAALKTANANRDTAQTQHTAAIASLASARALLEISLQSALGETKSKVEDARQAAQDAKRTVTAENRWLEEHKSDATLIDGLSKIAVAVAELKGTRNAVRNQWTAWLASASSLPSVDTKKLPSDLEAVTPAALATLLDGFLSGAQTAKDSLDKATKEAKAKLDALKKKLDQAKLVASLESHRPHLNEGQPCPLCGALEHPYAGGAPDNQSQSLEREVEKAEAAWENAGDTSKAAGNTISSLVTNRKAIDSDLKSLIESRTELAAALQPFGVVPAPKQEDQLSSDLQAREKTYRMHLNARDEAVRTEKDANKAVADAEKEIATLTSQIEKLPPAPDGAAPAKKPAPVAVDEAQTSFVAASDNESTKAALLKQRKTDAEEADKKCDTLRVALEKNVAATEFKTLDSLRAALLDNAVAVVLDQLDTQLRDDATKAAALLDAARKEIKQLRDLKTLEGEEAEKFKHKQDELDGKKEALVAEQTRRSGRITTDDENRRRKAEQERATSEARDLLAVWQRLRDLIGTADGSKFRKYAQSITLDILLRHANRHLSKLNDRYRIGRRESAALDLEIEDFYQAQAKRPMSSLSGGESFLVSLALALGLSDLAGRNVRIQSLFIDEGFGSLDPEALEIAIAALEGLRQEEKTIGVISHVEVLKERIGTQVVVEKQAGGISTLRVVAA